MPTTSVVPTVIFPKCGSCRVQCLSERVWKEAVPCVTICFTSAELKPRFVLRTDSSIPAALILWFKAQVDCNRGRAQGDSPAGLWLSHVSPLLRSKCSGATVPAGRSEEVTKPYFLHKQRPLAVNNHEGVAGGKTELWKINQRLML